MFGTRPSSPRSPIFRFTFYLFLIIFIILFVCLHHSRPGRPIIFILCLFPGLTLSSHSAIAGAQQNKTHSCQKKVTTAAYAAGTQQLTSSSTLSSPPECPKSLLSGLRKGVEKLCHDGRELRNQRLGADLHICTWFALTLFFLLPTKQHTWRRDPPHRSHRILGPDTCWPPLALAVSISG